MDNSDDEGKRNVRAKKVIDGSTKVARILSIHRWKQRRDLHQKVDKILGRKTFGQYLENETGEIAYVDENEFSTAVFKDEGEFSKELALIENNFDRDPPD